MPMNPHPETLGVFAPIDHVVISFATTQDMEGAAAELLRQGFANEALIRYTPEQMKAQADIDIARASPLANLGQELNLVRAHRELADEGYSFLVVRAPKAEQTAAVQAVARSFHAERAQKYGNFLIEELIAPADDSEQVFESPARGLD
jgi:hypothetical protein